MADGRGAAGFVRLRGRPDSTGARRLGVSFLSTSGRLTAFRNVATLIPAIGGGYNPLPFAAASDGRGRMAVAWAETVRDYRRGRVKVAFGTRARGFGQPVTLARGRGLGGVEAVSVSLGPKRDALVAWSTGSEVLARFLREKRTVGQAERAGPTHEGIGIVTALNARGDAALAWETRHTGECGPYAPKVVRVALRPAGRPSFAASRVQDRGDVRACEALSIRAGLDRRGRVIVGWSRFLQRSGGVTRVVRVATGEPGATHLAFYLDLGEGDLGDVALGADGSALVTWDDAFDPLASTDPGPDNPPLFAVGTVMASIRPRPSSAFTTEAVSAPGSDHQSPVGQFDPHTEAPVAAWVSRPLVGDPPAPVFQASRVPLSRRTVAPSADTEGS